VRASVIVVPPYPRRRQHASVASDRAGAMTGTIVNLWWRIKWIDQILLLRKALQVERKLQ